MPDDLLLSNEVLSLDQIATRLGVTHEEILRREALGELFSYVKPRLSDDRRYPEYQLARELHPHLVYIASQVLTPDGALLDSFFNSRDRDLAQLSVREVLAGRAFKTQDPASGDGHDASWILAQPTSRRLGLVLGALERLRAVSQDWP